MKNKKNPTFLPRIIKITGYESWATSRICLTKHGKI